MRLFWRFLFTLSLGVWLWLGQPTWGWAATIPPRLIAQNAFESSPNSSGGLNSSYIPSEKVSQFVVACLKVVALIERREGELQGVETELESLRMQQDIEAEAIAIIEATGLTRPEYLQLLSLANVDPEFGERIAVLLQEGIS